MRFHFKENMRNKVPTAKGDSTMTKVIININNLTINNNTSTASTPYESDNRKTNKVKKYYAVARGRKRGIFTEWFGHDGAKAQVEGYSNNRFKSFKSYDDTIDFLKKTCK